VLGRQSVWSDPEVLDLSKSFVLATDEVYALASGRGPEADFFRSFASKGYARMQAGQTQQGIYCITPTGELLSSDNTRDPRRAVRGLKDALSRWQSLPRERRLRATAPEKNPGGRERYEDLYPKDGLVLRVFIRDVGNARAMGGIPSPFNVDFAWFKAEEARQLVPPAIRAGETQAWPDAVVRRIARLHLVDIATFLGDAWQDRSIEKAALTSRITDVKGDLATLRLSGEVKASQDTRTLQATLLGRATFDVRTRRFTEFDIVAAGPRSGIGHRSSAEDHPSTIGFVFQLAGDTPAEHVPPNFFGGYGWRR
jgi:hypothetical protein